MKCDSDWKPSTCPGPGHCPAGCTYSGQYGASTACKTFYNLMYMHAFRGGIIRDVLLDCDFIRDVLFDTLSVDDKRYVLDACSACATECYDTQIREFINDAQRRSIKNKIDYAWAKAAVELPAGTSQVRFKGVKGTISTGHMAVDEVELHKAGPQCSV
jgi:hypothetical protein